MGENNLLEADLSHTTHLQDLLPEVNSFFSLVQKKES
jgi:hypothetical protein